MLDGTAVEEELLTADEEAGGEEFSGTSMADSKSVWLVVSVIEPIVLPKHRLSVETHVTPPQFGVLPQRSRHCAKVVVNTTN